MTNAEILSINLPLINKIVDCYAYRYNTPYSLIKDFKQELYLILLEHDNTKLNEVYNANHINCYVTRIVCNQLCSYTSPFFNKYRKLQKKFTEINESICNMPEN